MSRQVILVVLDGLRRDFVTEDLTPNIAALTSEGVAFRNHHASFPSVTRVNSSSIATGCHPGNHGIVDNTLYLPAIQPEPINTGSHTHLRALDIATAGGLLSTNSLTEILGSYGHNVAVVTTSSSGACFLQNHRGIGLMVNGEFIDPPPARDLIESRFGPAPDKEAQVLRLNQWAASILTDYVLPELRPELTVVWLCDPDKTQHGFGLGAEESLTAIRYVDEIVGQLVRALDDTGTRDQTDLFVMSDHGWVSYRDPLQVKTKLIEAGIKQSADSDDLIVAGQGVYIDPKSGVAAEEVVCRLHQMDEIGALFTLEEMEGAIPFSKIVYDHPRSPDVLFVPAWDDTPNVNGVPGMAFGGGPGGHGGSSPFEMRTLLTANGPSFLSESEITTPTGHVDLLPTILHLLDHPPVPEKDGRILLEALRDGVSQTEIESKSDTLSIGSGTKEVTLRRSFVDDVFYFDSATSSAK